MGVFKTARENKRTKNAQAQASIRGARSRGARATSPLERISKPAEIEEISGKILNQ
jgi:hypothetical protein